MNNTFVPSIRYILIFITMILLIPEGKSAIPICGHCPNEPGVGENEILCGIAFLTSACFGENRRANPKNLITRTFKTPKSRIQKKGAIERRPRGRNKSLSNPLLELSLDSADMAALFAINNTRIQIVSDVDTVNTIMMDVGDASADTQYWNMPTFDIFTSQATQSIDTADNPYQWLYPGSNVVYKSLQTEPGNDVYSHFRLSESDSVLTFGGVVQDSMGEPSNWDFFETLAFLPIEFGWKIEEWYTVEWDTLSPVDSTQYLKVVVLDATGMLTPINEDPVPAILAFTTLDYREYKDGVVVDTGFTDSFVWFTTEGHMLTGQLKDHAPTEGETEFVKFIYEKNILACPPNQDLGVDLYPGAFKAQNQIQCGAQLTQGPIQFIAGNDIELKDGFSTDKELELFIDADPCNFE